MTQPTNGNNGFINHKIRFFIVNIDNIVIKCVAYGALAHVFQDLWNSTNANVVDKNVQYCQKVKNIHSHNCNLDMFHFVDLHY
ncbi:hypothetical protein YC2023_015713 [Brassica napus]